MVQINVSAQESGAEGYPCHIERSLGFQSGWGGVSRHELPSGFAYARVVISSAKETSIGS